jgi:16S rRNA (adenine1518-N6/adenine1519-N6)-dimethyltransferase
MNIKAKKSYGQHFLINEPLTQQIADSLLHTAQYQHVVEVGPGKGMLTKYLLHQADRYQLTAVEADQDMVNYLAIHYPTLKVIKKDFLQVPLDELVNHQAFGLIGNFPYNISSQILFKMLDYKHLIPEMVGMFQKEVAQRVVATPNGKEYGVISVLIQAYYDGFYLFEIDKSNFAPPPKVQSAVIRMVRKENQDLGCDPVLFKQIVKMAFGQRRKMLRNTMKSYFKDETILQEKFFTLRPENLSVQDYIELTNRIQQQEASPNPSKGGEL